MEEASVPAELSGSGDTKGGRGRPCGTPADKSRTTSSACDPKLRSRPDGGVRVRWVVALANVAAARRPHSRDVLATDAPMAGGGYERSSGIQCSAIGFRG